MNSYSNRTASSAAARRRAEDLRWLKKAKRRIQATLVLAYALILIFPFAIYFVLAQPIFSKPSYFNTLYLLVLLVQIIVWLMIFFLAGSAKKYSKALFNTALLAQFAFSFWLVYDMFGHAGYLTFYLAWFTLSMVENFFLIYIKRKIYDSWASSVFFDHVLVLDEDDAWKEEQRARQMERQMEIERRQQQARRMQMQNQRPMSDRRMSGQPSPNRNAYNTQTNSPVHPPTGGVYEYSRPDYSSNRELEMKNRVDRERQARKTLSARYPRTAIRMAIGVYGELILFPIITHIFQNSFVSIDNSNVFAVGLMFSLCILTAVVWTIPILFCYLKYPGVRKSLYAALFGQLLILGWGVYNLYSYSRSETIVYAHNVFLMFTIFEVVRYAILLIAVFPAFRLPEIEDTFSDIDDDTPSRSALSRLRHPFVADESGPAFELYEDDEYEDEPDTEYKGEGSDEDADDQNSSSASSFHPSAIKNALLSRLHPFHEEDEQESADESDDAYDDYPNADADPEMNEEFYDDANPDEAAASYSSNPARSAPANGRLPKRPRRY